MANFAGRTVYGWHRVNRWPMETEPVKQDGKKAWVKKGPELESAQNESDSHQSVFPSVPQAKSGRVHGLHKILQHRNIHFMLGNLEGWIHGYKWWLTGGCSPEMRWVHSQQPQVAVFPQRGQPEHASRPYPWPPGSNSQVHARTWCKLGTPPLDASEGNNMEHAWIITHWISSCAFLHMHAQVTQDLITRLNMDWSHGMIFWSWNSSSCEDHPDHTMWP